MSEKEEKLQQFTAITGASSENAKFFLESAAWNVEMAMARYYECNGDVETDNKIFLSSEQSREADSENTTSTTTPRPTKSSKIATLNSLTSSSDDGEEGQAFYAGGSEHSGQQVLGPPRKRDIVADMFKSVQEHGVEILEPDGTKSGSSNRIFKGTGYKLGQNSSTSEVVPGQQESLEPQEITLMLWQNGFSLNNGPLREYTDPANKEFLESIKKGEIPHELRQGFTEVHLAMEDHRMEEYKAPKVHAKPFQGQGYTLGSPTPVVVGASVDDKKENDIKAKEIVNTDNLKPVTSLQIRLADGSRLIGTFNHEHTVATIRTYITTARPQYQVQSFNLLSSYPSKVLDESLSIKDAGLLNSTIIQKLI